MARSLMICLSFSVWLLVACSATKTTSNNELNSSLSNNVPVFKFDGDQSLKLKTEINVKNARLSGITIIKVKNDSLSGAFVNEFGIKGFEFVLNNHRCTFTNLLPKLNKWYIRRTLESDFLMIFNRYALPIQQSDSVKNTIGRIRFEIRLEKDKIVNINRYGGKKINGILTVYGDSIVTMKNTRWNLEYNFSPIIESMDN
jgi:hypothetical protein